MAIQLELIKSIPYFSGLSPAELDSVKGLISERQAERGEFILLEGEPADALYFVISGVVKVFKTSAEGKEQILQLIRPGESFNDVPIFDGGPNPASAQAMGPVVLYSIKNSDMRGNTAESPSGSSECSAGFVTEAEESGIARGGLILQTCHCSASQDTSGIRRRWLSSQTAAYTAGDGSYSGHCPGDNWQVAQRIGG